MRGKREMMMRVLCLLILGFHAANSQSVSLIESTCTRCAEMRDFTMPSLPYCRSSLQAAATVYEQVRLRGLGDVALRLANENATATAKTIQAMLDGGASDGPLLKACLEAYKSRGVMNDVQNAILFYTHKDYNAAYIKMNMAMWRAASCDELFQTEGSGKASPLATENDNLQKLSLISMCIISLVQRDRFSI